MTAGLATTFEALTASRNDAVAPLLLAGLESAESEVYGRVLQAIVARRSKQGHLAVVQRWHQLSPQQRETIQEGRGRMSGALRDAVLSDDDQLFENACELVENFQEYDLVTTLVTLAENQNSKHAEAATDLVLRLVQQLSEAIHSPRAGKDRRNPEAIGRFVLESLERSVERFRKHKRSELIEAFVILGGRTSGLLRQILEEPHHPCYLAVINTLTTSQCAGVFDFLLNSLQADFASLNILNVISKRNDREFVSTLLEYCNGEMSSKALKNIGRIRSFAWLQSGSQGYASFDEQDQARCIRLVAASGAKPDELLDLLESILRKGGPLARWAACEALASVPGDRGNQLVLDAIQDRDAKVQAAATRQIRDRHVPGAMAILLQQIDSPYDEVREATREALGEFSFANFLAGFEGLHDEARRTTGALVKKVDPDSVPGILAEMTAKSRKRRLRAIEMADVMELVPEVADDLLGLLEDADHLVRANAADALQFCPTDKVQVALRQAANDRSTAVQNSAKNSLAVFDEISSSRKTGKGNSTEGQR